MFGYHHNYNYNTKNDSNNNNKNNDKHYIFFFKLFFEQKLKGVAPFASPTSFSVWLLSSLCIWYGMCKILYHVTYRYPTSVPYHLMQYELVMVVIVISLCLSYKSLIVGNLNRKMMHIFGFVGIFEYIC